MGTPFLISYLLATSLEVAPGPAGWGQEGVGYFLYGSGSQLTQVSTLPLLQPYWWSSLLSQEFLPEFPYLNLSPTRILIFSSMPK